MPYYFDPVAYEQVDINQETIIYLVKNEDKFAIKAISEGIRKLTHEPSTRATFYWAIDTIKLVNEQYLNPVIFPSNQLTTESLMLNQVTEYLGIDPTKSLPMQFRNGMLTLDTMRNTNRFTEEVDNEEDDYTRHAVESPVAITQQLSTNTGNYFNNQNSLRAPVVNLYYSMAARNNGSPHHQQSTFFYPTNASFTVTEGRLSGFEHRLTQPIVSSYRQSLADLNPNTHAQPGRFFSQRRRVSSEVLYGAQPTLPRPEATPRGLTSEFLEQMLDIALHFNVPVDWLFNQQEEAVDSLHQTVGFI